jgi:small subunit ribosomal protein S6e
MNIVISDPKTGKAYSKNTEKPMFIGKKIGDEVKLDELGLQGYVAKIRGGTDKDGFPMKPTLTGTARRKVLLERGVGMRETEKGLRRRKTMRGNIVAEDIAQLNLVIIKHGKEPIEKLLGKKQEEAKKEEKG